MWKGIFCLAFAIVLSSCSQTLDQSNAFIQRTLPQACNALSAAYTGFMAFAEAGTVKESTVRKVNTAFEGVSVVCENPSQATAFDVIIRVTTATSIIVKARKEVENAKI